jgi:spoIIIJ-associated protein
MAGNKVSERKYSVRTIGEKVDQFLKTVLVQGRFRVDYEIEDASPRPDDFETPDVMVRFNGADIDLLLANRAELMLALEHVTLEVLGVPSEDHSRLCFDAND